MADFAPEGASWPSEILGCLTENCGLESDGSSGELAVGGVETTTAEGAEQNRMDVGRWNMCLRRAQFNFAMGMVTTKPQQIKQTTNIKGAMMQTKVSQKQTLPRISLFLLPTLTMLADDSDEEREPE